MLLWDRNWFNGFSPSGVVAQRAGESSGWAQMIHMRARLITPGVLISLSGFLVGELVVYPVCTFSHMDNTF